MLNKNSQDIIAIIPAAGIGKRMNIDLPKQYLLLDNLTIIEHSILRLLSVSDIKKIYVVISSNDVFFKKLPISKNHRVFTVIGGKTRFESVFSGLKAINAHINWVLIHDAVRPFLNKKDLIRLLAIRCYSKVGAILASPITNTIKISNNLYKNKILKTLDRERLWNAMTPQLFPYKVLLYCFNQVYKKKICVTDESSTLEIFGYFPEIIEGNSTNIKITTIEDLLFANFYLQHRKK
ncbi:2-C-methyl-D-erythritol 4-phosphate cytidylyltransferase [Candidatus Tachikawaea gelatinosa]|uniref:2-C-methyl-D-erythritol 4-phosphate cytidylyltransferase n=1 Tax=Candidatus Tachikawaea gelatinosa TaxID=1410383 RepID=A0A090BWF9_9ENTR|nr:2-C-methyl-D-erythritol 4-phosphate cytidylyltransferase [Candidatus Tachikawaea gelatinosa]BAP58536.1 2-C-methyl-D-erythritol 4-phosphate cytidylyltransferase [Candidatus Tachikawaea gelatinosa]